MAATTTISNEVILNLYFKYSSMLCGVVFIGPFDIYISKAAFASKPRLYLELGHELLHTSYPLSGKNLSTFQEHASIFKWQLELGKAFYLSSDAKAQWNNFRPFYNPANDELWQRLIPIRSLKSFGW